MTAPYLHTTATMVEKFKKEAKKRTKASGGAKKHTESLDEIAREHGYDHWKAVMVSQERTSDDALKASHEQRTQADPPRPPHGR